LTDWAKLLGMWIVLFPCGCIAPARKYWESNPAENISLRDLVALAKQRWTIERDCQELKQELGLGHFEGRGWRGFHHHATLAIAAYAFLGSERSRFSPSAHAGHLGLSTPQLPAGFQSRWWQFLDRFQDLAPVELWSACFDPSLCVLRHRSTQ
jgi:hypothetical protein